MWITTDMWVPPLRQHSTSDVPKSTAKERKTKEKLLGDFFFFFKHHARGKPSGCFVKGCVGVCESEGTEREGRGVNGWE